MVCFPAPHDLAPASPLSSSPFAHCALCTDLLTVTWTFFGLSTSTHCFLFLWKFLPLEIYMTHFLTSFKSELKYHFLIPEAFLTSTNTASCTPSWSTLWFLPCTWPYCPKTTCHWICTRHTTTSQEHEEHEHRRIWSPSFELDLSVLWEPGTPVGVLDFRYSCSEIHPARQGSGIWPVLRNPEEQVSDQEHISFAICLFHPHRKYLPGVPPNRTP